MEQLWSNTHLKLKEIINIFYCYKCQKKLDYADIFGCRHAIYCKDCFSIDGLRCKINIDCEISRVQRFQNVLKLCEEMNVLINKDHIKDMNADNYNDEINISNSIAQKKESDHQGQLIDANFYNQLIDKENLTSCIDSAIMQKDIINMDSVNNKSTSIYDESRIKILSIDEDLGKGSKNLLDNSELLDPLETNSKPFTRKDVAASNALDNIDNNPTSSHQFGKDCNSLLIENDRLKTSRKCKSLMRRKVSGYSTPSNKKAKAKITTKNDINMKGSSVSSPIASLNTSVEVTPTKKRTTPLATPKMSAKVTPIMKPVLTPIMKPVFTPRREYSARKSWTGRLSDLKSASPKDLLSRNMKGETILHVACIKGEIATVSKLLDSGFDPNVKDFANWTPLHEASNHGYREICEMLIRHGALVDVCGDGNCTPLHDAIVNFRFDCVQLLLEHGASITQRNANGLTAMDLKTSDEIQLLLRRHLSNKDMNKNHDKLELVDIGDEALPDEIIVTTSGFDEETQNKIADTVKKLGWKYTNTFKSEVTHVIAKLSDTKTCKRTLKTMAAILLGRWIINEQWLKSALNKGGWIEENKFMIKICGLSQKDKAPSKSKLAFKKQLPPLFNGCRFFVSHGISPNLKDDLIQLIKLGGGQLLSREPKLDVAIDNETIVPFHTTQSSMLKNCSYFVICPDSDFEPKGSQTSSCIILVGKKLGRVNASWVFDSISQYSLIDELIL